MPGSGQKQVHIDAARLLVRAQHDDGSFRVDPSVDHSSALFSPHVFHPDEDLRLLLLTSFDQTGRLRVNPMARRNKLVMTTINAKVFEALVNCTNPVVYVYDAPESHHRSTYQEFGHVIFRDNATLRRFKLIKGWDLEHYFFTNPRAILVYLRDPRVMQDAANPKKYNHYFYGQLFTLFSYCREEHKEVVRTGFSIILESAASRGQLQDAMAAMDERVRLLGNFKPVADELKAEFARWDGADLRRAWVSAVVRSGAVGVPAGAVETHFSPGWRFGLD
jgi:hypothetical protein